MRNGCAIALAVASLLVSACGGTDDSVHPLFDGHEGTAITLQTAQATTNLLVLQALASNDFDKARRQLEFDLDAKALAFADVLDSPHLLDGEPDLRRMMSCTLRHLQDYRAKNPWKQDDPAIGRLVEAVLEREWQCPGCTQSGEAAHCAAAPQPVEPVRAM